MDIKQQQHGSRMYYTMARIHYGVTCIKYNILLTIIPLIFLGMT